jgi:hypothetical protein
MQEQSMIEAAILRLTAERGPDKSICPTDVARAVMPGPGDAWRQKLSAVRRAAERLAQTGQIEILRKGKLVEPVGVKGVIRLRQPAPSEAS